MTETPETTEDQPAAPAQDAQPTMADPAHPSARDRIGQALLLKRERVTGDTIADKDAQRSTLDALILRLSTPSDAPGMGRPTADELRDALGDPDEADIRHALDQWDVG